MRPGLRAYLLRFSDVKVHYKIAFPFAILFLGSTLVPAYFALSMTTSALEQRVTQQAASASEVISQTDLALNKAVLDRLKQVINAEIVTYTGEGEIIASTFPAESSNFIRAIQDPAIDRRILKEGSIFETRELTSEGIPHYIAYRPVASRPDAIVALVANVSDKARAAEAIQRSVAILAIIVVVTMLVASQVLARWISRPLLELVEVTRAVAAGDLTKKAQVQGKDEIGMLSSAFNEMVDDLRKSEEKILESEKLAVAGLMAARVAHDIRNPLSSIKMQVQLLQPRIAPGQGNPELVRSILNQIDRVEQVVKGLLELARPAELKPVPTDLHRFLDEILQQNDAQMRHRKITVITRFDSAIPELPLDAERLTHAILNILFNAADSMPTGGSILVATKLESASTALLEISDEGEGIDPAIANRVFEPFMSTKKQGVGLGLGNAKGVVEGHGGAIELKPRPGGGTSAVIRLPTGTPQ